MRTSAFAAAAAVLLTLTMSACGDHATSKAAASQAPAVADPNSNPPPGKTQFGAACATFPTDPANPGSFESMAKRPVAAAVAANPAMSSLADAAKRAGLTNALNAAPGITVFAPANVAFSKLPKDDLRKLLADKKGLAGILNYHVVPGKVTPDHLAGQHKTRQGGTISVTRQGAKYKVNGRSTVVCGNVQTANATIYLIDTLLTPPR
ncbi:fasciclin domain-containing protein [Actinoplanes sp. KI2]|uniref:fasciclin domain-containing protein n=1 Tax=Actinoplanes sp. KI2 TaxID=2983315 RepID=UPI0021D60875|nr:fasciclin domain-containing protein [Actinoplanes sp. KI2]MCU7729053.1 fasciclin domain-containing protein [Actinoplanes sp. KI2]